MSGYLEIRIAVMFVMNVIAAGAFVFSLITSKAKPVRKRMWKGFLLLWIVVLVLLVELIMKKYIYIRFQFNLGLIVALIAVALGGLYLALSAVRKEAKLEKSNRSP